MRYVLWPIALLLILTACGGGIKSAPLTAPSPLPTLAGRASVAEPSQSKVAGEGLSVSITPDFEKSFAQVAGRVPFTVTFGVKVTGGAPPYQVGWDFEGDGKTDSTQEKPAAVVFAKPGEYNATVTVRDSTGQIASAARRIVAIGAPNIPAWKYGVMAHLERRRAGYYPTLEDVTRAAELMQSAGIQAARIDFNWDMLNQTENHWSFEDYDAMVRIVREHNVDILAILDYASWWASSAQDSTDWRVRLYSEPRNYNDFARFAYQVVMHYKHDVHVWEIWNEPNTAGFWKPQPNAAHYTQLLQGAYLAVKYADPNAVVVFAGLSGNGVEGDDKSGLASNFIADAYTAGARTYFDALAIHPYMLPNSGIASVHTKIAAARAVLDRHGDEKIPVWITEIGVPSETPWWQTAPIQSDADIAAWLEQVYTRLWDLTPTIFWYDLQDQSIGQTAEQHFGLLRLDFSAKPAYEKYRTLARGK
jgi:GH35 family endo-1,4-beta-xylanase